MARVAVIDTGTNSTRLLVADVHAGHVDEQIRRARITRLGEGVDATGRLEAAVRERVQSCVSAYAELIAAEEVSRALILATSSVRDAANGNEFISGLAKTMAFDYRILTGEEEASLSFTGATMELMPDSRTLFFDVGGGSTEIAAGKPGLVEYARSLGIGCVRIGERFLGSDPVKGKELAAAADFIDEMLAAEVNKQHLQGADTAVAVAGTVTSLAAIDMNLKKYDADAVHGHVLTRANVDRLLERLAAMKLKERHGIATLERGRADVIVGGTVIVSRLLAFTGIDAFTVSERDILDGAALKLAAGAL